MSISAIQSGQAVYEAASVQKKSNSTTETPSSRAIGTDTVKISDEAKMMAMYAPGSKVMTVGKHQIIVAPDEDGNYISQEQLEADWDRLARIPPGSDDLLPFARMSVGKTDPAREAAYRDLTARERKDLNEYSFKVINAFRDEYHSRGMTILDYEAQTENNDELRQEIDRAFRERLLADPRAVELMKQFDIPYLKSVTRNA